MGSLGAALATMVANLSAHKRGWDDRWEEFSDWAERGKAIQERLLQLVDEDTRAYNKIIEAVGLPKKTAAETKVRDKAIEAATLYAIQIPYEVMRVAYSGFEVVYAMAETGNPNSVSDAGVGALALFTCMEGAWLNVRINASGRSGHPDLVKILADCKKILVQAHTYKEEVLAIVGQKITG
jgi:glutamate formiminotransferase/formiminotetrahydrofolate cyclodeaminase